MDYKINIAQLTWQVFGVPGYLPSLPPERETEGGRQYPNLRDVVIADESSEWENKENTITGILKTDTSDVKSMFGYPVFDFLHLKNPGAEELKLNDAPIITITRPRNIVKTSIQGRERGGTIKEFISNDDYHITVSGLLADKHDKMPWEKLKELKKFLESSDTYEITSKFLQELEITHVVIDQIGEIKPVDGYSNVIQYSFTMLSDDAPELKI